ncbi:uncharacterized protein LOC130985835 [Salvia miltiorrhiza]|uniref:uncharacterized protein LOC130985835 n=1 Tax=Salvia miltiorrhiza TaxID=226208 RepID=UPI0025AC7D04|nr:uncharacterized protein LOC130985835 [Salvia miltiorrhiza]
MDNPTQATKTRNPLKYTFDARFSPDTPQDDSSEFSNSSFQVIANSMARMEAAQLEMMKKREMARLDTQRRQAELDHEMTRMMLQTQAHIASTICHTRKRKNNSDHHSTTTTSAQNMHSDGALLLTLLLSNMI